MGTLFAVYELEVPFEEFIKTQLPGIADEAFYLLAENGVWLVKQSPFYLTITPTESIAGLEPATQRVRLKLPRKITSNEFWSFTNFFREVYLQIDKSEALTLLYWDNVKETYHFHIPEQEVSAVYMAYLVGENPEGMTRLGTIHSHAKNGAFHSFADQKDEEHDDGLHITVGRMDQFPFVDVSCEFVADGIRVKYVPSSIIDLGFQVKEIAPTIMKKVKAWKGGIGMKKVAGPVITTYQVQPPPSLSQYPLAGPPVAQSTLTPPAGTVIPAPKPNPSSVIVPASTPFTKEMDQLFADIEASNPGRRNGRGGRHR